MPLITPITYLFLLPRPTTFSTLGACDDVDYETPAYVPLATDEDEDNTEVVASKLPQVQLSAGDKWRLLKPMVAKYMLPLCKLSVLDLRSSLTSVSVCVYLVSVFYPISSSLLP